MPWRCSEPHRPSSLTTSSASPGRSTGSSSSSFCIALVAALTWGVVGRVPTRAAGEGILDQRRRPRRRRGIRRGRPAGDDQRRSLVITSPRANRSREIVQTDIQQRYAGAVEVFHEKERQHKDLIEKTERELASKRQNFAKLEAAFNQVIKATIAAHRISGGRRQESRGLAGEGTTRRDAISRTAGASSPTRSSEGKTPRTKS